MAGAIRQCDRRHRDDAGKGLQNTSGAVVHARDFHALGTRIGNHRTSALFSQRSNTFQFMV